MKITSDNRLILDELASITANLAFLSQSIEIKLERIKDFEKQFRRQIGNANKHITPPNLEGSKKVPIEKLFVPSNFTHTIKKGKVQELLLAISYPAFIGLSFSVTLAAVSRRLHENFATTLRHSIPSDWLREGN